MDVYSPESKYELSTNVQTEEHKKKTESDVNTYVLQQL